MDISIDQSRQNWKANTYSHNMPDSQISGLEKQDNPTKA